MKIYLAGPMRGYKAYNHPAFDAAAAKLRAEGHSVFSPAEHDREAFPEFDWYNMTGNMEADGLTDSNMRTVIKKDLNWIADNADAIVLLSGWQKSHGVKIEHALGEFLGLYIREIL